MRHTGASADADRAATPSGPSPAVLGVAGIPSADAIAEDRTQLLGALYEARLQLVYLEERWPTGTSASVIARIEAVLRNALPWAVFASVIEARSGETAQQAQSEGRERGGEAGRPETSGQSKGGER